MHAWGALGFDFKSHLQFYNVGNSNRAIKMTKYIEILEQEVTTWPSWAILEEDGCSGHGPHKNSIVTKWKKDHHVKYYFNAPYSPDLAPIKNGWQAPKAYLRKFEHWTEEMVVEVALEGWHALSKKKINKWCESMPDRLQDVIRLKGQMTAW